MKTLKAICLLSATISYSGLWAACETEKAIVKKGFQVEFVYHLHHLNSSKPPTKITLEGKLHPRSAVPKVAECRRHVGNGQLFFNEEFQPVFDLHIGEKKLIGYTFNWLGRLMVFHFYAQVKGKRYINPGYIAYGDNRYFSVADGDFGNLIGLKNFRSVNNGFTDLMRFNGTRPVPHKIIRNNAHIGVGELNGDRYEVTMESYIFNF